MVAIFIYAVTFLLAMLVVWKLYYSSTPPASVRAKNPPPSPPKWPIIGNLHQLSPLIHRSFFSLSQRYGRDLMLVHLGAVPSLVVSTVESAREILQTHDLQFADRPTANAFKKISYNYKELGLAPYGEYWRQAKKLLVLHCLTAKQVQTYSEVRNQEVTITLDKIANLSARNEVVNLSDLLVQHSNDVSARVTFGRKYNEGETGKKFRRVMEDIDEALVHFYFEETIPQLGWIDRITGATRKCDEASKAMDEFLEAALEERGAKINSQESNRDLGEGAEPWIDVLLRNNKYDDVGLTLDRDGIKALLMDLYVGGADTVASVIEWTIAELLAHPSILKKVQTEIRTIAKNKKHITNDEIDQMKYFRAVIMESTRLHPPAPVIAPRIATEDVNVMGFDIAKGTRVFVSAWAVGRDPKAWDKPNDFMPERFLGDSINFVKHDFKLIPFGAGRRGCPGRIFGMAIVENLFAHVLCNFDFALPDDVKKDGINMTETAGLMNRPKFPLLAFATPCP